MEYTKHRIAVLVDTSSGWGRRVIRGIANYGLKHGSWQLSVDEIGINEAMHLKPDWQGHGIIARVSDKRLLNELVASGKPVVNVSGIQLNGRQLPSVTTDYNKVAQLAVQHFAERGFRHLGYYGLGNYSYVKRHTEAFVNCAKMQNLPCQVLHKKLNKSTRSREAERKELKSWLENLPKPIGILSWGTRLSHDILNVCSESGIAVPEEIAVLAGDYDDLLCDVCDPPLSGVVTPAEQIGHEAARMLDMLLKGKVPEETTMIEPTGIHIQRSTDTQVIADPVLAKALQYIHEHMHRPIQVGDVAEAVNVSRRSLERRFEVALGYSPSRKIQKAHLERAQKLLKETDMSMTDIAAASGYGSAEYMICIFKKATGLTPLKYRTWLRAY